MKTPLSEILFNLAIERKEAEILTAFLLNKSRESLLANPEIELNEQFYKKLRVLEKKRLQNYPIAYLVGKKEFYGLDFKVNNKVMVPRPETEIMIDNIIDIFKQTANNFDKDSKILIEATDTKNENPLFIDLGTGSGAIIISLNHELKRLFPKNYTSFEFKATDISPGALQVAKNNAIFHNLNKTIKFYQGDLLKPVAKFLTERDVIIAANLPYLTLEQVKQSPSISREPKLALVAGSDGLKYYRELFKQLQDIKYKSLILFCEIDPSQTAAINALAGASFPAASFEIIKDLADLDRFLKISIL